MNLFVIIGEQTAKFFEIVSYIVYVIIGLAIIIPLIVVISKFILIPLFTKIKIKRKTKQKITIYEPREIEKEQITKETIKNLQEKITLTEKTTIEKEQKYTKKPLITDCEDYFYNIIKEYFNKDYIVQSQVPLSSIVDKIEDTYYKNELYRTIDIGIFDKKTKLPILMIEIDDKTHQQAKRRYRDYRVKEILNDANIKLIKFYTNKTNTPQYIVDRIRRELKN